MEKDDKKLADETPETETPESGTLESETPPESETEAVDSAIEHGGPKGPEPTRYGDWEKGGRCTDF